MRTPFLPSFVFNRRVKPSRSTEVMVASIASTPAWNCASKIIESTWSPLMCARMPDAASVKGSGGHVRNPLPRATLQSEAAHTVQVNGLEPEEIEIRKIDPVTTVFMTGKIHLSNRKQIPCRNRFGQRRSAWPEQPQGIAIRIRLSNEEAASRVRRQIPGIHGPYG
jgi:hypothetical protein